MIKNLFHVIQKSLLQEKKDLIYMLELYLT